MTKAQLDSTLREFQSHREVALLNIKQVASWLGVSVSTIRRWIREESFPGFKLRKQWRFTREDVETWINDQA